MKITQMRNAAIVVETNGYGILVDPMLSQKGSLPPLKWLTKTRKRNPLTGLPANSGEILNKVTHCLITHCRRGHFDHLDRTGIKWLIIKDIPVYCTQDDAGYLRKKSLRTHIIKKSGTTSFLDGTISPVHCLHGRGIIGRFMVHGSGYFLKLPEQPSLYLAGDTILTDRIKDFIKQNKPDISIIPTGGAKLDIGGKIIMGIEDAVEFGSICEGIIIANHLEVLDHCPVSRTVLRDAVIANGIENKFKIPDDGETMVFNRKS